MSFEALDEPDAGHAGSNGHAADADAELPRRVSLSAPQPLLVAALMEQVKAANAAAEQARGAAEAWVDAVPARVFSAKQPP